MFRSERTRHEPTQAVDLRVDPGLGHVIRSRWASSPGTIRRDRTLRIGAAAHGAGGLIPTCSGLYGPPRHDRPYRAAGDVARPAFRDSKSRSNPHFRSFARIISYSGRSDGSASPLLRVSTQRASYSSLASEQCLALQVFPAEPAQQLAIPLESHPVEVPRNRGLGSEGSKAADYLMLEYFEGPQLLGLDIASDLSLNRCHSSAPPPKNHCQAGSSLPYRLLPRYRNVRGEGVSAKYSAGVGVMMLLTS